MSPILRHPAFVAVGLWNGTGESPHPGTSAGVAREGRITALTLAALLMAGGLIGSVNLFMGDAVPDGPLRQVYAGTMALLLAAAVPLALSERVSRRTTFALVLIGDLVYVVAALCVEDPVRYASPLMLLFTAFAAAWFLGPWQLGVNMVVTAVVCAVAMAPSYADPATLAVQVGVSAAMLDLASLGVFLLRRRVERLLAATEALTSLDPLTGLFNRRYLAQQAPRVWRQARRDGARVVGMVLDLDHFKQLNDAHGHAAGDAVLRAVAGALAATVRPADVLARTGGEELVVLGQVSDADEARRLAERLRAAVAGARSEQGHAVTTSVGLSLTRPVDGEEAGAALWRLIDRADAAMYEAKRQGRDRVAVQLLPRALPRHEAVSHRPGAPASDVA